MPFAQPTPDLVLDYQLSQDQNPFHAYHQSENSLGPAAMASHPARSWEQLMLDSTLPDPFEPGPLPFHLLPPDPDGGTICPSTLAGSISLTAGTADASSAPVPPPNHDPAVSPKSQQHASLAQLKRLSINPARPENPFQAGLFCLPAPPAPEQPAGPDQLTPFSEFFKQQQQQQQTGAGAGTGPGPAATAPPHDPFWDQPFALPSGTGTGIGTAGNQSLFAGWPFQSPTDVGMPDVSGILLRRPSSAPPTPIDVQSLGLLFSAAAPEREAPEAAGESAAGPSQNAHDSGSGRLNRPSGLRVDTGHLGAGPSADGRSGSGTGSGGASQSAILRRAHSVPPGDGSGSRAGSIFDSLGPLLGPAAGPAPVLEPAAAATATPEPTAAAGCTDGSDNSGSSRRATGHDEPPLSFAREIHAGGLRPLHGGAGAGQPPVSSGISMGISMAGPAMSFAGVRKSTASPRPRPVRATTAGGPRAAAAGAAEYPQQLQQHQPPPPGRPQYLVPTESGHVMIVEEPGPVQQMHPFGCGGPAELATVGEFEIVRLSKPSRAAGAHRRQPSSRANPAHAQPAGRWASDLFADPHRPPPHQQHQQYYHLTAHGHGAQQYLSHAAHAGHPPQQHPHPQMQQHSAGPTQYVQMSVPVELAMSMAGGLFVPGAGGGGVRMQMPVPVQARPGQIHPHQQHPHGQPHPLLAAQYGAGAAAAPTPGRIPRQVMEEHGWTSLS